MEGLIEVKDLSISFAKKKKKNQVLKDINFKIDQGDRLVIIGESGSGKSTLVDALMGILPENSIIEKGRVKIGGETIDLTDPIYSKKGASDFKLSIIFQDAKESLNPSLTILDQFKDYLVWHKIAKKDQVEEKARKILEKLGFTDIDRLLGSYPHELSGGMAQKVAIAILALGQSKLLIADEPTSALDIISGNEVIEALMKLENKTMMVITHDLRIAKKLATKILVLNQGQVREFGSREEILNRPQDPYTKSLIQSYREVEELEARAQEEKEAILKIKNIRKNYKDYQALKDLNFQVKKGEILGILGASGSGKTTISKMIMGIERPDTGQIDYQGRDLLALSRKERKKLSPEIQIIFQNPRAILNPRYPVKELVKEVLINTGSYRPEEMEELAEYYLEKVGLTPDYYTKRPPELSTGQCQRVAIVRAIISRPKILICDEAISALDQNIQGEIIKLLLELKDQLDISMIMITHDIRVLRGISNRILVLKDGENLGIYTDQELEASQDPYIQKLLA